MLGCPASVTRGPSPHSLSAQGASWDPSPPRGTWSWAVCPAAAHSRSIGICSVRGFFISSALRHQGLVLARTVPWHLRDRPPLPTANGLSRRRPHPREEPGFQEGTGCTSTRVSSETRVKGVWVSSGCLLVRAHGPFVSRPRAACSETCACPSDCCSPQRPRPCSVVSLLRVESLLQGARESNTCCGDKSWDRIPAIQ